MDSVLYVITILVVLCSIIPLIIHTNALVSSLQKYKAKIKYRDDTNTSLKLLDDTIKTCVAATNQSMVYYLKKTRSFTQLEKDEAFDVCRSKIDSMLHCSDVQKLRKYYGNLDQWINCRIEYYVRILKR